MEPKPFQKKSAEWIVKQLFRSKGKGRQSRVLLADEVGLGKTIVARTVIEELTKMRSAHNKKTTVLYLCSNADLARQNSKKLNGKLFEHRLSELAIYRPSHEIDKPVIISASTGTNISLKNKTGTKRERAILYQICCNVFHIPTKDTSFEKFMGGGLTPESWQSAVKEVKALYEDNEGIESAFAAGVTLLTDPVVSRESILNTAREYEDNGGKHKLRGKIIGCMREELVKAGLMHGPKLNLIIMDEFQRFEDILQDANKPDSVTHQLLNKGRAPVLLLSATPFKMYSSTWDEGAHHDTQMINLLTFLYGGEADGKTSVEEIKKLLHHYRHQLLDAAAGRGDHEERINTKNKLETLIGRVMIRTERRALSGSLMEPVENSSLGLRPDMKDFQHYFMLRRAKLDGFEAVLMSFWQSAPYLLSFCDSQYKFKQKFLRDGRHIHKELAQPMFSSLRNHMVLTTDANKTRARLNITHPRLQGLMRRCLEEQKSAEWVWLPPSKSYWKPSGVFAAAGTQPSKVLVFSNWRFVPKAVASLLSMEAENVLNRKWGKRNKEVRAMKITSKEGSTHFIVLYPSMFLAEMIQPLEIIRKRMGNKGDSLRWSEVKAEAVRILKRKLKELGVTVTGKGPMPQHKIYQWLVRLDYLSNPKDTEEAIKGMLRNQQFQKDHDKDENKSLVAWRNQISAEMRDAGEMVIPVKGVELLAAIALASPATTLLRSLKTHFHHTPPKQLHYQSVSFCMYTLRSFLTKSHVFSIIKQTDKRSKYWNDILSYGIQGNIQAMWDEYISMLSTEESDISKVLNNLQMVLGMSDRNLEADQFTSNGDLGKRRPFPVGYCLPFSDDQKEEKADGKERVRQAFNSPFWPHVLVTTSVGQEGLDFHRYCREIVHWNLPSNPIDFEQREGRINRFRSLAVRQAVGEEIVWNSAFAAGTAKTPWGMLFQAASERQPPEGKDNGLWPDWVFHGENENGKTRLVRHVWLFPFSKDNLRYKRMREMVVLYRLAFGQPNQEDFIKAIQSRLKGSEMNEADLANRYMIDLGPK